MAIGTNIFATTGISGGASLVGGNGDGSPSLASATYGPAAAGQMGPFSPRHGIGLGFWLAAGAVAALVVIRQSLPR